MTLTNDLTCVTCHQKDKPGPSGTAGPTLLRDHFTLVHGVNNQGLMLEAFELSFQSNRTLANMLRLQKWEPN